LFFFSLQVVLWHCEVLRCAFPAGGHAGLPSVGQRGERGESASSDLAMPEDDLQREEKHGSVVPPV
jgi:hypothetical protein